MPSSQASGKPSKDSRVTRTQHTKILYSMLTIVWLPVLVWWAIAEHDAMIHELPTLISWGALMAAVNMLPLRDGNSAPFAADDPVGTAIALMFPPLTAAILVFIGAVDPRELKGATSPSKALCNRTQVSICWWLGSMAAHAFAAQRSLLPHPASSSRPRGRN